MPDIDVHTITNVESLLIEYPPPRGLGAVGGVRSRIVGKMAALFRSADHPNESPRMAVVGNVLTYHEGQIHIGLRKSLRS